MRPDLRGVLLMQARAPCLELTSSRSRSASWFGVAYIA